MQRFFLPGEALAGDRVELDAETLHHLATVLRLRPGAEVELLDGAGLICRCRLESFTRRHGTAAVLERRREEETGFPVRLLQGLPKGDKMDLVLQKGTELGIGRFVPILAGRSIAGRAPDREEKRLQRWRRIIREAARQSRRPVLPAIEPPVSLEAGLAGCDEELRLLLWEEGERPLTEELTAITPASAAILVGPEGGFSSAEADAARAAGFVPVRVGPRILRTETAGLALAAVLQYLYGDLGTVAGPADSP